MLEGVKSKEATQNDEIMLLQDLLFNFATCTEIPVEQPWFEPGSSASVKWTFLNKNTFKLKADRPHPRDYPHTPPDYGHTDKTVGLVRTTLYFKFEGNCLCCTRQSRAPNIDRYAPDIWHWPWPWPLTLTFDLDSDLWPWPQSKVKVN